MEVRIGNRPICQTRGIGRLEWLYSVTMGPEFLKRFGLESQMWLDHFKKGWLLF